MTGQENNGKSGRNTYSKQSASGRTRVTSDKRTSLGGASSTHSSPSVGNSSARRGNSVRAASSRSTASTRGTASGSRGLVRSTSSRGNSSVRNSAGSTSSSRSAAGRKNITGTGSTVKTGRRSTEYEDMYYDSGRINGTDIAAAVFGACICIFLVLCYFGLCGSFGNAVNTVIFGIFGVIGYVFPFTLLFSIVFYIANKNNRSITRRIVGLIIMQIFLCGLIQVLCADYNPDLKFVDYFNRSIISYKGESKVYGGIVSFLFSRFLCPYLGEIGTGFVMFAAVIASFMLIIGDALIKSINKAKERSFEREQFSESQREYGEDDYYEPEEYPVEEKAVSRKKVTDSEFDELDAIITQETQKKTGFIDSLSRIGMGMGKEEKRMSEMPEFRDMKDAFGSTEFEMNEISAADKEEVSHQNAETKAAAEKLEDFARLEIDRKFADRRRDLIENRNNTVKLNSNGITRLHIVDEDEEDFVIDAKDDSSKERNKLNHDTTESNSRDNTYSKSETDEVKESDAEDRRPFNTIIESPFRKQAEIQSEEKKSITETFSESEDIEDKTLKDKAEDENNDGNADDNIKERKSDDIITVNSAEELPAYIFPSIDLLNKSEKKNHDDGSRMNSELNETVDKLQRTFQSFNVGVTVTNATCGPTVTRYELLPDQGVKVKTITALSDDIKLALAAAEIRIEAPIPGKAAVGIEVPNRETSPVLFRDLIDSAEFRDAHSNLTFAVGKDIGGKTICFDIGAMPHMLIAGATGSGKSVCINALIMSIIYKAKPSDVRMIMIDPKRVELIGYNGIPHLLVPVVTDVKKATGALNWAIAEMDDRYGRFADAGVNNLASYNRLMEERYYEEGKEGECPDRLPQILIIVDELNDLMMTANSKEVESAIVRLTQLARASGIHVVLATQRPSVNVITGTIKANIPSRIAFAVSSLVDSRTIIDQGGAEKLLGKGDMLFYPQGYPKPVRLQGAYVSDKEVAKVVAFVKEKSKEVKYSDKVSRHIENNQMGESSKQTQNKESESQEERDELFAAAGNFIIEKQKASIGMLQRKYKIGFNRAARIMDQLADCKVVGPEEGTKPRQICMNVMQFADFLEGKGIANDRETYSELNENEDNTTDPENEE